MAKQGRMKAKILDLGEADAETVESELNHALKELSEYYITDIKPIGSGLVAILYFSQKKEA